MKEIYFDYNATTPVDAGVMQKMTPYFCDIFGNNSSLHAFGRKSQEAVDSARDKIAQLLNCKSNEIYFTSGGTESDNWALRGIATKDKAKNHIITTKIEHHAIINCSKELQKEGIEVTYLDVDSQGRVDIEQLKESITDRTCLVSIIYANNEVGTIQPIEEIAKICHQKGIVFHTDAVQAASTLEMDVQKLGVDMLSISAHKFYGPKGIGLLYIKNGVKPNKFIIGGAQERSMRAGTTNTPAIVGFAEAFSLARSHREETANHCFELKQHLKQRIENEIEDIKINGAEDGLKNTLNVSFSRIEGESLLLLMDMNGIALSSGSACASGSLSPSHVLLAMGLPEGLAHGSLRFSFGKNNTMEEVDYAADCLVDVVKKLRFMSPIKKK